MMFAATQVDLTEFINELKEGNLFVWGIVVAAVFFTCLHAYQKYRSFSKPAEADFE